MQYLDASQKWKNDLCSFQGKPFNVTVIYSNHSNAPTSNAEEAEVELFYEYLQD